MIQKTYILKFKHIQLLPSLMLKCMIVSEIAVKYCHFLYNLFINKYLSYILLYGHYFGFICLYVYLVLLCHAFINKTEKEVTKLRLLVSYFSVV